MPAAQHVHWIPLSLAVVRRLVSCLAVVTRQHVVHARAMAYGADPPHFIVIVWHAAHGVKVLATTAARVTASEVAFAEAVRFCAVEAAV